MMTQEQLVAARRARTAQRWAAGLLALTTAILVVSFALGYKIYWWSWVMQAGMWVQLSSNLASKPTQPNLYFLWGGVGLMAIAVIGMVHAGRLIAHP